MKYLPENSTNSKNLNKVNHLSSETRQSWFVSKVVVALSVEALYVALVIAFLGKLQAFAYQPAYVAHIDWEKAVAAGIIVLIWAFFVPTKSKPSNWFLSAIYLVMIVPRFCVLACRGEDWLYPLICLALFSIALLVNSFMRDIQAPQLFKGRRDVLALSYVTIAVVAILYIVVILYYLGTQGMPSLAALDFDNVYEIRANQGGSSFVNFMKTLTGAYLTPLILAYCLSVRKYKPAILLSLCEMMMFLWSANKMWLFIILLIWVAHLCFAKKKMTISLFAVITAVVVSSVSILASAMNSEALDWAFSLLIRRTLIIPSILGFDYFDFFASHPPVLFEGTVLSVLTPLSSLNPSYGYQNLISLSAFGSAQGYANTGLFGAEYAHFGDWSWTIILANLIIFMILFKFVINQESDQFLSLMAITFAFLLLNASSVRMLFSPTGLITIVFFVSLLLSFSALQQNGLEKAEGYK